MKNNHHNSIHILGAKEHNLKNVDLSIPKNKLVVFTGVSGSGKSSLAFDTIYNEGQRRYMESFSAYARQFMGNMERPNVDKITGLSPVISIEQKTTNKNPRSTVGTITEIYDFIRLLYARIGEPFSYNTHKKMVKFSEEEIVQILLKQYHHEKIMFLAPIVRGRKGHYRELLEEFRKKGFPRAYIDGNVTDLAPKLQLDRYKIHDIEIIIDQLKVKEEMLQRIHQAVQQSLKIGNGLMFILRLADNKKIQFSKMLVCEDTGISYEEPSPNTFSFNSPYGACPHCKGLGEIYAINPSLVIPDNTLSINKGGIAPLGEERSASIYQQVKQFAQKHKIKLDIPIKDLPKESLLLLLFGENGIENYTLDETTIDSDATLEYQGIIPQMKKWFFSTQSDYYREWAEKFMTLDTCPSCQGNRLRQESLWFKINNKNIAEISQYDLAELMKWFSQIETVLNEKQNIIAKDILKEIRERLQFLLDVGLEYLTLHRPTKTLSGGESQRIRLASQIGSKLQGITYILDEPSIGLHQRDNQRLIKSLQNLRNIGNSVLVVEHDKDIMLASDFLVDIGPKAGKNGGEIIVAAPPKTFVKNTHSLTAQYLKGEIYIPTPKQRREGNGHAIQLLGASGNNLQNIDISLPLGKLIVVTGVSGSGKSTLINETLYPLLSQHCYHSKMQPLAYKSIHGLEHIDKVIEIDQTPIGRTPRSNPATYCGFFTDIRTLLAATPEAKIRGYKPGRFSFNIKGGRCDICEGAGLKTIEMNFLPNVYVHCDKCNGKRYNKETLEIKYKGKNISDILLMTVDEAAIFFEAIPSLHRKIATLQDVGLGYITLGQSATTLSGGEAQRIKLATELSKKDTGKTFYILDEPTTGLHFSDIVQLMQVLEKLVNKGNTVLIIEHNLDVIKTADHIIDIGPEGGKDGGKLLFSGTPEEMINVHNSHTAKFLKLEMKH